MKSRAERHGEVLVVVIPEEVAKDACIADDTEIDVSGRDGTIVISRHRPTLEELVAGITEENRHEETDWGPPVGNEIW